MECVAHLPIFSDVLELNTENCRETHADANHPESTEWFIEDQAFLLSNASAPPPPPPSLTRQQIVSSFSVLRPAYWRERGGGGGRGAKSYDRDKYYPL